MSAHAECRGGKCDDCYHEGYVIGAEEREDGLRWMLAHAVGLLAAPWDYQPSTCPICAKINDFTIDLADNARIE